MGNCCRHCSINAYFSATPVQNTLLLFLIYLAQGELHLTPYAVAEFQIPVGNCTHYGRWPQHDFTSLKKLRPQSVTSRIQPGSDVIVCAEMDEQWGYVGAKSRQRWLFYAYDSLRKTVVAHVFGERTMATLGRLMSLLSPFDVVIWMTDGWPLYESRLKGKLHVISKRYTQRIERHNLNLRQHLARLGRKSLSFSKSVELHDKVIGHYLNIKHYQ
ncbi:IS1 ORF [Shigella sonnei]|nr:IS1 ORF [Shigella sonnei]